ncbi:hypothetical protein E2C01_099973 [Portunus trituberculatus]|uniref:Uncharacterized protein n=1 Tax=Portunus trituberculatus TaxID=210409 RepID=A0A5B7KC41_PORTR|nr:hypothetical protein [Portunus trituberculatus]
MQCNRSGNAGSGAGSVRWSQDQFYSRGRTGQRTEAVLEVRHLCCDQL